MRHAPFILIGVLLVALSVTAHANAEPARFGLKAPVLSKKGEPPIVWPDSECTLANRMDIAVVEGMFFECQCMRLQDGYQCDWYLVAGVESPAELRKRIKRTKLHSHRVIHARPSVIA